VVTTTTTLIGTILSLRGFELIIIEEFALAQKMFWTLVFLGQSSA
jgi:hypothetical protein